MRWLFLFFVLKLSTTNAQLPEVTQRQITILVKIFPTWQEPKDYHIYFLTPHIVYAEVLRDYDKRIFGERIKLLVSRNQAHLISNGSKCFVTVIWPSKNFTPDTLFRRDIHSIKQEYSPLVVKNITSSLQ
jgi:hypothetical protein